MDDQIRHAVAHDRTIDITTTGRTSGQPRRIEIWFHNLNDQIYITGTPGTRDWYANLVAHPAFTFHFKESVQVDLDAHAHPITDHNAKRAVLGPILDRLGRAADLETWVEKSPLVKVTFDTQA